MLGDQIFSAARIRFPCFGAAAVGCCLEGVDWCVGVAHAQRVIAHPVAGVCRTAIVSTTCIVHYLCDGLVRDESVSRRQVALLSS